MKLSMILKAAPLGLALILTTNAIAANKVLDQTIRL
jgi:hypothetical protein